jgi:hypothetical protein
MTENTGHFDTLVRAIPPVIGSDTEGVIAPPVSGTPGEFCTNTVAIPPVVGNESLKLRLRIQIPPTGDSRALALALHRLIESASEMDRALGGKGLTKLSQEAEDGAVVVVLGSVDPVGGDERIGRIVVAMNQRNQAEMKVVASAA